MERRMVKYFEKCCCRECLDRGRRVIDIPKGRAWKLIMSEHSELSRLTRRVQLSDAEC
jgi:hypothetical protein